MNDEGFRLPKNRKDRYRLINSVLSVTNNISQAAFALNISKNTVKKERDLMENGESQLPNLGRPNKITKKIKYFIIINSIFYPETSSEKVAQFITESYGISISASTIRNARHKYGFNFGPRIYVLHLDDNLDV